MDIRPTFTGVGELFKSELVYFIPIYQRSYSWEDDSITDFINDVKICYTNRTNGEEKDHFFGGILSIKKELENTVNKYIYEIVDGQQRLTTFTLLVRAIIDIYVDLQADAIGTDNEPIIIKRIDKLTKRFIKFDIEKGRREESINVLETSKADKAFYRDLMNKLELNSTRDSHKKLENAHSKIYIEIKKIIDAKSTVDDKIDALEIFENVIDADFTVIHMTTDNKDDAYRLFQVINDRGLSLTDGDLLRATTLEYLESDTTKQDYIERIWNEILSDEPSITKRYLNWIYESYFGKRPKQNELYDVFLKGFFPNKDDKEAIYQKMIDIKKDVEKCRSLEKGIWVYEFQNPVTPWDRERLIFLIEVLDHKLALPLLLVVSREFNHKDFSTIVQILEKTYFRYKLICNGHVTTLKNSYSSIISDIHNPQETVTISTIKRKLQTLIDDNANDDYFKASLYEKLEYSKNNKSNQIIKYFLLTIEYHYEWYKNGALGTPNCDDKSRVYSFNATSIEHIYPKNARTADLDNDIESEKNKIGNLFILDPELNSSAGNDNFIDKKPVFQRSSVEILKQIGLKTQWTITEVNEHKALLLDIASKVYKVN